MSSTLSDNQISSQGNYATDRKHLIQVKERGEDIVVLVPGTQDPVNTDSDQYAADRTYWSRDHSNSVNLSGRFWDEIFELTEQPRRVHFFSGYFSWSGDNNIAERQEAAKQLWDLIREKYAPLARRTVSFHLIGHSHGGQVINELTRCDFPEKWKIKSITYLSTPFFSNKHEPERKHLHSDYRIVNVYNQFDLTQRFIAKYNLIQLTALSERFNDHGPLGSISTRFREVAGRVRRNAKAAMFWLSIDEAITLSADLRLAMLLLKSFVEGLIDAVNMLKQHHPEIVANGVANRIREKATDLQMPIDSALRKMDASPSLTKIGVAYDLALLRPELLAIAAKVNRLLAGKDPVHDSWLSDIFGKFLSNVLEFQELPSNKPWESYVGIIEESKVKTLIVTETDPYYQENRIVDFERFLSELKAGSPSEVVFRLLAQLDYKTHFETAKLWLDLFSSISRSMILAQHDPESAYANAESLSEDFLAEEENLTPITELRVTLATYLKTLEEYNRHLTTAKKDEEHNDYEYKLGSIQYLLMISHSVSRWQLWGELRESLLKAFDSTK
jgi:hypothetical protein